MATRILGSTGSKKRRRFLLAPVLLVALVAIGALVTGGSVFAAPSTDSSVSEYSQCANGKPPGTTTACPQNWINGILNANNSGYHEDDNTAQRLFLDLPRNGPTTNRTITLKYLARKGQGGVGNHAYDSLGQWNYTQTSADRCQGVTATNCPGGVESKFTIPVDNQVVADSNGAGSSTALHELPAANRYMSMFGGTITNISTPVHDNASGSGDDYAQVVVTYSVTSTPAKVELLFGGHLAPAVGSRGWGVGVGASFINGGPYHIKLVGVDSSSIGNRDNQITAGAILPIGTEVQTALHETDSTGAELNPPNDQDPTTQTGISVTLPSNGNGAYVTDYATVLPATATGTVAFRYYSTQAACTADTNFTGGTLAGSGKTLNASGVATSDTKQITAAGNYYWRAHFTGTNLSVDSDSGCTHEILTANQATSTSTTLHQTDSTGADLASPNNGSSITVTLPSNGTGVYVKDVAGIVPASVNSGSVTFRYYSSSSACTADTAFTGGTLAGTGNVSSGSASGDTLHLTSAGKLYFRAVYSGDSTNNINGSSSTCGDEILTINQATSTSTTLHQTDSTGADLASPNNGASITVPVGAYVKDFASILPASVNSGSVTFRYYSGPNASTDCSNDTNGTGGGDGGSGNVSSGSASGSAVHFTSAGTFYWRAFYSGNAANNINGSSSTCGDEILTVQKASPTIASDPRLIPQDHATIAGILAGGSTQATMTFTLWGPDNPTCDATDLAHPSWYSEQQNVNGTGTKSFTTNNSGDPLVNTGFRLTNLALTGVWHWSVDYSGDEANAANHRDCTEAFDFEGITNAAAG